MTPKLNKDSFAPCVVEYAMTKMVNGKSTSSLLRKLILPHLYLENPLKCVGSHLALNKCGQ